MNGINRKGKKIQLAARQFNILMNFDRKPSSRVYWHILLLCLVLSFQTFAQNKAESTAPQWNGYVQARFSDNYWNITGFSIRRAKLWVGGKAPLPGNWHYKVQGIFRTVFGGAFTLQDVFAEYDWPVLHLRIGQQVPDFSLQRSQPDYWISPIERSRVVDILIPSSDTGARDIGVQGKLVFPAKWGHSSFGIFNGNGGNFQMNEDREYLLTHRSEIRILTSNVRWQMGYSLAYRRTLGLRFQKIFGSDTLFSGDDFRWGVESRLSNYRWELQGEYIEAHLENIKVWGYYLLGSLLFTKQDQILFSVDKFSGILNKDTNPWFILGFNHLFAGYHAKLMLDTRMQFAEERTNYLTTIQLQLFFNSSKKE